MVSASPEVIKKAMSNPFRIPIHLLKQQSQLRRRRDTHQAVVNYLAANFDRKAVVSYYEELKENREFISQINNTVFDNVYTVPEQAVTVYIITRLLKPERVVETGVHTGWSSACFLQAMTQNGGGELYSIDLPGTEDSPVVDTANPLRDVNKYTLPEESVVGFRVPDRFSENWNLQLGRSDELLEPLLDDLGEIDLFFHDSDHSYENVMYELTTAFPTVQSGGVVLIDDADWNSAVEEFCGKRGLEYDWLGNYLDEKYKENATLFGRIPLENPHISALIKPEG